MISEQYCVGNRVFEIIIPNDVDIDIYELNLNSQNKEHREHKGLFEFAKLNQEKDSPVVISGMYLDKNGSNDIKRLGIATFCLMLYKKHYPNIKILAGVESIEGASLSKEGKPFVKKMRELGIIEP